ncbi:hypothetical protein FA13DRAFT_1797897 [Coprinellus micaceus]|uniref:Uncharacterized protein n=1 Tax=Coprinellus micaceus TaxID=71717 RepID=A0A4Y7SNW9_COPMI|nr:hypothetical protein FA13DRAFT_1797897 [Coprinellus micaceus]
MTRGSQRRHQIFVEFLLAKYSLLQLALLEPHYQADILKDAPPYGSLRCDRTWKNLLAEALRVMEPLREGSANHDAVFDTVSLHLAKWLAANRKPTHQEKRSLARNLGLLREPYTVNKYLSSAASFEEGAQKILDEFGVKVILREKDNTQGYKRGYTLVEDPAYVTKDKTYVCSEENGFYHVAPDESVIFVSPPASPSQPYNIELVVLRDVLEESEFTEPLLGWLTAVICTATCNRRNVRPTHPGAMVQVGINMGPRHARLLWNLARAYLPQEVTTEITDFLDRLDYPSLATRNVATGSGFSINYKDQVYTFSSAGRAPPEGVANWAFHMTSHRDGSPLRWSLALTAMREVLLNSPLPANYGSNLVDLSLRVIVQSRVGSLTAFDSNSLHGTTQHGPGIDPICAGISLTSTSRVYKAYSEMQERGGPVVFVGAAVDPRMHETTGN